MIVTCYCYIFVFIWVNYNDRTLFSRTLESWLVRGIAGLACHIGSDQHIHRSVGSHISPRNWLL